ncbi:fimbria/pilus outer membrane usher protein [Acinetobacter gerneri]|uniref:fimbria/pilus outer membrane usher protein n=1 Tax=Acinetobacter gerneri TaxID=202952 RepID=UPI003A86F1DA
MKKTYCCAVLQVLGFGLFYSYSDQSFADDNPSISTAQTEQDLYLNVVLNQSSDEVIGHFLQTENDLLVDRETLAKLHLNVQLADEANHPNFISLKKIKGLASQYDASRQLMTLTASEKLLGASEQIVGYDRITPALVNPDQMKPGVLFNYDFYAQQNKDSWSLSGWNELRFWGLSQGSVFSISANHLYTKTDQDESFKSEVLDTYWQKDFQDKAITLTLGDSQSRALDWSRSTRISGLRIAKNYSLQPYQVTSPLESFKGSVLLPSTVDLLINGIKQSTNQVSPGQFNVQSVPSITGAGNAQLVITDLNGQQRVVNFSLFGSAQLLREGLADWDVNLGVSKLDYAIKSFSYGDDPVFNGSYRYGLSNDTTLESHAEFGKDLYMSGVGVVQRLPSTLGIVNGSYSYSQFNNDAGQQYNLGYEWSNKVFNVSLKHQQATDQYADIATSQGYSYTKRLNQAFVGINTPYGQFGGSYAEQEYEQAKNKFAIFNWSYVFASHSYLNFNMTRDLENKNNSFYLSLNIPLDRQTNATVYAQRDDDTNKYSASVRRTAMQDKPDWGWLANANYTDSDHYLMQAQLQRQNNYGEWNVGIQNSKMNGQDYTTSMASTRGSLVMMQNHLFAMRQSLGSFAVVSTDGVADIPVQIENRTIGKTNKHGLLLVDYLNAYQHNNISIDTLALPVDYKIETTRIDAVPHNGTGIYVKFPIYRIRSIQFTAHDLNGQELAMGSAVWNQEQSPAENQPAQTIVAREGLIYLENPKSSHLFVEHNGDYCQIDLPDLSQQFGYIDLGNLICK